MPTLAHGPLTTDACKSADWCASLTLSRIRRQPSICWATCSTSGTNINMWCQRASPASWARYLSSPTWASRCTTSQATTTSGPTTIWRRSVASFCTSSRRPWNSMERSSTWLMATDWATLTSRSNSSAASSITRHANGSSRLSIPVGDCGLVSPGPSTRASSTRAKGCLSIWATTRST